MLEEVRDRRYNEYALILQKAFRKFNAVQYFLKLKNEAADIMYQKKERRALSVNNNFNNSNSIISKCKIQINFLR